MEDKERGSLEQKPALELILELYHGGVTGSLKLERTPLQKAVYFRDGQILFAASNDPKDQLASILVEEGKLGPDQMQVAQARVSSGNPLAKVLTELGYISQRELAEAARVKVARILTDLYMWTEGNFEFATKSLPKGAIDLDLSTPHLITASIRRIQDRDWVLRELGSLETALTPSEILDTFINETKADAQTIDVLRQADGTKTVQEIASLSNLGEFEVCKILAAAVVVGAMTKGASVTASEDAFAFPTDDPEAAPASHPVFSSSPSIELPASGEVETVGLPIPPPEQEADPIFEPPDDTVFEPPQELEKTVFETPPAIESLANEPTSANKPEPMSATASELIIDEPEPDIEDDSSRRGPPKPKGRRGGAAPSRDLSGILKIASVVALAAAAAFSVYYFVLPLVMGGSEATGTRAGAETTVATTNPPPSTTPPPSRAAADPHAGTAEPTRDPRATTTPPAATSPPRPTPTPPPRQAQEAPPSPSTTTTRRTPPPQPPPPTRAGSPSSGNARQQLAAGNLNGAARSFLAQLRASSANKFTIAVGLYCDEDNAGRIVTSASGSEQIFILPTTVQGRSCYRIMWGLFDTRQAATSSMGSLPNGIRAGDAAAVPLTRLLR